MKINLAGKTLIIILVLFGGILLQDNFVNATIHPDPQIKISDELTQKLTARPDCDTVNGKTICKNSWIADYIEAVYKYLIGIVGILATVVMMIGGVIWITAGGNASRIGEAKAWIGGALMGLVLALASYTILYQINDETVKIKPIIYTKVDGEDGHSTSWDEGGDYICCQKSWLVGTTWVYDCANRLETEGCPSNSLSFSTWTKKDGLCNSISGKCE